MPTSDTVPAPPPNERVQTAIVEEREVLTDERAEHQEQLDRIDTQLARLDRAMEALSSDAELEPRAPAAASPPSADPPAPQPKPEDKTGPAFVGEGKAAVADRVVEAVRDLGGTAKRGDIWRHVGTSAWSEYTLGVGVKTAIEQGRLRAEGKGSGTRYVLVETSTPATPPADRDRPVGGEDQEPTVEGRILSYCQTPHTGPEISLHLETSLNELRALLGKMLREGELRTRREEGELHYVTA